MINKDLEKAVAQLQVTVKQAVASLEGKQSKIAIELNAACKQASAAIQKYEKDNAKALDEIRKNIDKFTRK